MVQLEVWDVLEVAWVEGSQRRAVLDGARRDGDVRLSTAGTGQRTGETGRPGAGRSVPWLQSKAMG